ncbi:DUF445 domain-containing protein [Sulfidibacter corallicola]|uniref:DUF445 domain-containing protein n=1 Tax=Sulfidibacter corallicola TaxID=2818388 RepID=A0A8A4TF49_SULCO|nr:DUF445 domain-containing protein [Sulfidibacter corallicola]QTD47842.1 hypothetical protein J3U87_19830 [Sulfidibacter corallicola]
MDNISIDDMTSKEREEVPVSAMDEHTGLPEGEQSAPDGPKNGTERAETEPTIGTVPTVMPPATFFGETVPTEAPPNGKPRINKSLLVNGICIALIVIGQFLPEPFRHHVLGAGYFGFSGAITNWLAIHMLFERVPGLYGSGIIPLKFESFKKAIRNMIMNQFFTVDNIRRFMEGGSDKPLDLTPIIENLNYDYIYDAFVDVIKSSKFGGMLGMFGGSKALEPMRDPFKRKLREKLTEITQQPEFLSSIAKRDEGPDMYAHWQEKIENMVNSRLEELTPQMVKNIIQEMIRSHLGWLVVWGGVFGALIGFITSFLP